MGASDWHYAVAYQEDVAAALAALKADVFASGEYYGGGDAPAKRPASIRELLGRVEESGTHTVIDMFSGVSSAPAMFSVSPLTSEQLVGFFGSTRPTAAQAQEWMDAGRYSDVRERWSGVYIVSWAGDTPDKLHFGGFSGD